MNAVVVVESPAKAKTIEKYLGGDYRVLASFGHVRDLPPKDGSVRPDEDFAMDWEADERGQKQVKAIASGDPVTSSSTAPQKQLPTCVMAFHPNSFVCAVQSTSHMQLCRVMEVTGCDGRPISDRLFRRRAP